eukprot:TRINITY_DN71900_c0_g1_i1.p1 TRINITY_DN71900_c0_g1~~TRINITY_DN71900_c0_g1_i1.p1  ORF type:complete len:275 (-),score=51.49 TRINITY_DN71900_c0_g1_i1:163-987(-)
MGATQLDIKEFGSNVTQALYSFWLYDLCDYFIELMKPIMWNKKDDDVEKIQTRQTLWVCLDFGLRLLHPFMPFLTEELWQRLPRSSDQKDFKSIMISTYAKQVDAWLNEDIEQQMNYLKLLIGRCRQLKNDYGILNKDKPDLYVLCNNSTKSNMLNSSTQEIATMSNVGNVKICSDKKNIPSDCGVAVVDDVCTLYLMLRGILDPAKELVKLEKKLDASQKQKIQLENKIKDSGYQEKTPEELKIADNEKLGKVSAEIETIQQVMESMRHMLSS